MKCPTCIGTGGSVAETLRTTWTEWSFVPRACPDCEGTGSIPDPCPVCNQPGHAMSAESGPGPLCAPRVQP